MGCCGGEREKGPTNQTQRWDFITLSDFKATSAWTSFAYVWLWFMAIVAVAVYALDTFTAINLIAFNKWSSSVQPKLAFKYSKWIFAGCIILSWTLALYEWTRAVRTIKRGGVAQSFLDPMAVNLQSMRPKGWRRFLVFTELTKSRKGADYVALFVYFAFKGAIRVILAEGPRQVVNGLTLYAVMDADLIVHGESTGNHSSFVQFFLNIGALANENLQQTLVYFSMLFTLIIWVFSALSLAVAALLYIFFLWHYIPQRDGRLRTYCKRKVDRRLEKILEHKIKAAVEDEERQRQKAEKKAELRSKKTGETLALPPNKLARQPTLPNFGESPDLKEDENESPNAPLTRTDTNTTLPPYSSMVPARNGGQQIQRKPTLPGVAGDRPPMPGRMNTAASNWSNAPSYASNAPLLDNTGFSGEDEAGVPPMPPPATYHVQNSVVYSGRPMPDRSMTQSARAFTPGPPSARSFTPGPPPARSFTPMSQEPTRPYSPAFTTASRPPPGPYGPPMRSNTDFSFGAEPQSAVSASTPQDTFHPPTSGAIRRETQGSVHTRQGSFPKPLPTQAPQVLYGQGPPLGRTGPPLQAGFVARPYTPAGADVARPYTPGVARPFTPVIIDRNQPTQQPDSYEMINQPSHSNNGQPTPTAGAYKAFNPNPSASIPAMEEPRRNVTVIGSSGAASDYFGNHVNHAPQRSFTAPAERRLTTGYADILDAYGSFSRNSVEEPAPLDQTVSRDSRPIGGLPRAATTVPDAPPQYKAFSRPTPPSDGPPRTATASPAWQRHY